MKITVITGSAHKKGTSAALVNEFIRGAEESGNEVFRFDAAFKKIHGCIGCNRCHVTEDGCVYKDDMELLNPYLLEADVVVFATPIYYYNMNGQLKTVIDRFFANDQKIHGNKKVIFITTMADDTITSAEGANLSFKNMAAFLDWEIIEILNGMDLYTIDSMADKDYAARAYELGKSIQSK